MKVVKLYITAVILALMVSTGAQAARPLDVAYSGAILEARAESIMGEMNFLVEETQGYVNFLTYLYGTGNTAISRPALDMKTFRLSWLQGVPAVSELNPNIQGSERIGEYPGKAAVVTGSRHFIDRMGLYRGQEINLSKYVVLDDFTGRLDLCVGIAIPEALKNYFPAPYLVRTQDGTLYATRMVVVPTGYSDIDLSSFLSTDGGNFSGIMDGSASRITADFLKYGDEQRDKVNTSTMYELLIGLFDKGFLNFADLPPAIWTLHETLVNRYADDILKKTGTVVLKRSLAEDPDLQSFLSYVQTLYFTSQEVDGKLDSLSSVVVNNQQFRDMLKTGINTAVRNGITLRNARLDDIEWTRTDMPLYMNITVPNNGLVFDEVNLGTVDWGWDRLKGVEYKSSGHPSYSAHIGSTYYRGVVLTSNFPDIDKRKLHLQGENISVQSPSYINISAGAYGSINLPDVRISSNTASPLDFQGEIIYNGNVTFMEPPVYDYAPHYLNGINIQVNSGIDSIASVNGNDVTVSEISVTIPSHLYAYYTGGGGMVTLNGRAIVKDKIESVNVSEIQDYIPIFAFGIEKGSITEEEKNQMAEYIFNNLYNQSISTVSNYIYDNIFDKMVFKASSYCLIRTSGSYKYYGINTSDLVEYFNDSSLFDIYDFHIKKYNPDFNVNDISSLSGSICYEISGIKYDTKQDFLFLTIDDATTGNSKNEKLFGYYHGYGGTINMQFMHTTDKRFMLRKGNEIVNIGAEVFRDYMNNPLNQGAYNFNQASNNKIGIVSNHDFENIELDEPLLFQFSDKNFIIIPSFKLYIAPKTVFLAR